jgi:S1-C subfamily serine protease
MRRTAAGLALALVLLLGAAPAHATPRTGVVVVETNIGYESAAAAGTAIVLTPSGEVLTNNHVIRGATTIRVRVPGSGRSYAASVVGYSISADVAVLQLKGASGLATASLGSSANLRKGQAVTAVGNAGGSGKLAVTTGTVTGLGRTITVSDDQGGSEQLTDLVQTDAPLQPGDSGGPLLDGSGRVIGVDTAASAGFYFQSPREGFAIPVDRAAALAREIEAGRSSVQVHVGGTAFLGLQLEPSAYYRGGSLAAGELVTGVVPRSPSAHAGIVAGDVITALDGRTVTSPAAVLARLFARHPGDTIRVSWIDQSTGRHDASVRLAAGPPQ